MCRCMSSHITLKVNRVPRKVDMKPFFFLCITCLSSPRPGKRARHQWSESALQSYQHPLNLSTCWHVTPTNSSVFYWILCDGSTLNSASGRQRKGCIFCIFIFAIFKKNKVLTMRRLFVFNPWGSVLLNHINWKSLPFVLCKMAPFGRWMKIQLNVLA